MIILHNNLCKPKMGRNRLLKLFDLFYKNKGVNYISPREIRIGLLSAILIYSVFSVVDRFMLPVNYKKVWVLRFFVITPGLFLFLVLSYSKTITRYVKIWFTLLVLMGQMGIATMVYIAGPNEAAYYEYYVGLILVALWAGFVFKLLPTQMLFVSITNVLFYNIVAVIFQKLPFKGTGSIDFAYFVNNNFMLIGTTIIATTGSTLLHKYNKRIELQNKVLEAEKNELHEAKLKAEESDRLKSSFLSNMSHEIRTPMNSIIGFTEMLKRPNITKLKEERYIDIIQSKGKQLLQLINDIIDVSRIEANELKIDPENVNLDELLEELKTTYIEVLKNEDKDNLVNLILEKPLLNEECVIYADGYRLRQVFTNLLSNAVKFTERGSVTFGYRFYNGKKIEIFVKDTGKGIPRDMQEIIFKRFRQIYDVDNQSGEGTGLGLHIVKNLVSLMGAELELNSKINRGSEFNIKLPVEPGSRDDREEEETILVKEDWGQKTILVAEDDPDNYLLLEEIFEPFKVKLLWAKNGIDAVEMFKNNKQIDLVLLDIKMPGKNGFEVAKELKSMRPDVPVIAQTAYAMREDAAKIEQAGCDDVIIKPIDSNVVIGVVKKHL